MITEYRAPEDWDWADIDPHLLDRWELEAWTYQQATEDPGER